ncbi:MAG: VRR-NUC domain-containing protein [Defluviitaleaceae bacterium]|nr:VRR-NUC domain-containing protein [Defluviitaleaceae bacterium]
MSESRLLYEIMREVGKYAAVYRCNSGSIKLPNGKRFNGMPRGFADVMAVLPGGRVAFIEVKADKGKPSPEQTQFINKMQGLGALAGIARSVSEALQICKITKDTGGETA